MEPEQKYQQAYKEIFLFINSSSGGGVGKEMVELNLKELSFNVSKSQFQKNKEPLVKVDVHLFNMKAIESKQQGFNRLKEATSHEERSVILVICGGDGTVMWVVTEMANFGIDHAKVPLAIIPLGTGNDFSQTFGWGKEGPDLLSNDYEKLKKRITYWLSAQEDKLDIWMVDAEVYEHGKFEKVEDFQSKLVPGLNIRRHFCNYFSLGVDGKIGYSFDLHRTTSRMGNLAVYGAMGLVKSFTKTKNMSDLGVSLRDSIEEEPIKILKAENNTDTRPLRQSQSKMEFNKVILEPGAKNIQTIEGNQNLLALNINSFMGGVVDVWRNAKVVPPLDQKNFAEQSHSDGKIEFISFSGPFALGCEKTISGNGHKVHQGTGPFEITFKEYSAEQKHRTYLQIDGQFIRYTHPSRLVIRRSNLSASGQIRVLRRIPMQKQKSCCA